jgi:hypothetical protein
MVSLGNICIIPCIQELKMMMLMMMIITIIIIIRDQ